MYMYMYMYMYMIVCVIQTVHITNIQARFDVRLTRNVKYQSTLSMLVTSMLSCMTGMLTPNFTLYGLCQIRPIPDAPGCPTYHQIQTWKGQGQGNTWSWVDLTIILICDFVYLLVIH